MLVGTVGLVIAVVLGLKSVDLWPDIKNPFATEKTDRSGPVLLKSIQDLSRYVAAEGSFQVLIDLQEDKKYIPDIFFNQRTLFVGAGTVNAYVDFSTLGEGAIKESADHKSVEITLPAPTLEKPNIDHDRSYVYSEERGLSTGSATSSAATRTASSSSTSSPRTRSPRRRGRASCRRAPSATPSRCSRACSSRSATRTSRSPSRRPDRGQGPSLTVGRGLASAPEATGSSCLHRRALPDVGSGARCRRPRSSQVASSSVTRRGGRRRLVPPRTSPIVGRSRARATSLTKASAYRPPGSRQVVRLDLVALLGERVVAEQVGRGRRRGSPRR